VTRHLWIGGLAPGVDRGTLVNVAQAFGQLQDVAMVEGTPVAFVSFASVQPACRAFELLDGQQVETVCWRLVETAICGCDCCVLWCCCSPVLNPHLSQLPMWLWPVWDSAMREGVDHSSHAVPRCRSCRGSSRWW
jgi:RNA recognition motif. (a.k.a. RRM, RBD, or RNP domain)